MSDLTTTSDDAQQPEPIDYTCRLCGTTTVFQPSIYQPKPGFGIGIAGMVYMAKRDAHCRGICLVCFKGTRRRLQRILAILDR